MRRPVSVRIGMFCRLGSVDDSRPVAAIIWLNVVWMRPSSPVARVRMSTKDLSLLTSRWRMMCSSTSASGLDASRFVSASESVV